MKVNFGIGEVKQTPSCHWYIWLQVEKTVRNAWKGTVNIVPILKQHAMKMYEGVEVQLQAFLTSKTGG